MVAECLDIQSKVDLYLLNILIDLISAMIHITFFNLQISVALILDCFFFLLL